MTALDKFTAAVAKAMRHTPFGLLDIQDVAGMHRIADRLGISDAERREVLASATMERAK